MKNKNNKTDSTFDKITDSGFKSITTTHPSLTKFPVASGILSVATHELHFDNPKNFKNLKKLLGEKYCDIKEVQEKTTDNSILLKVLKKHLVAEYEGACVVDAAFYKIVEELKL